MIEELNDKQKSSVAKLIKKIPQTEKVLKGKNGIGEKIFNLMIQNGFLKEIPGTGRKLSRFEFSIEAKEVFSTLVVPKVTKKRTKTAKRKPKSLDIETLQPIILRIINPYFESLEKRIRNIENSINIKSSENVDYSFNKEGSLVDRIKTHYQYINNTERKGGMVPIPKIWDLIEEEGYSRKSFVDQIFSLEHDRIIDLQTASDHKLLKEPEKAIHHPKRGYINYIVWRR